jgi:hypothetical protein
MKRISLLLLFIFVLNTNGFCQSELTDWKDDVLVDKIISYFLIVESRPYIEKQKYIDKSRMEILQSYAREDSIFKAEVNELFSRYQKLITASPSLENSNFKNLSQLAQIITDYPQQVSQNDQSRINKYGQISDEEYKSKIWQQHRVYFERVINFIEYYYKCKNYK